VGGEREKRGRLSASEIKEAEDLLRHLSAAVRNLRFYPAGHAVLKRSMDEARSSALSLLRDREQLHVGLLGDEWIVESTLLHKSAVIASDLRERLVERGLTSLTLERGLAGDDIQALALALTRDPEQIKREGANKVLKQLGSRSVSLGRVVPTAEAAHAAETIVEEEPELQSALELLAVSEETTANLYSEAAEGAFDFDSAKDMLSDIMDLVHSDNDNLDTILGLKGHDDYTFTHIVNVCVLTLAQARRIKLREETLDNIGLAALMHDVGKQRVPAEIIRKPSRLTEEEFAIMKMHTVYGAEMLRDMPGAPDLAAMVAFEHHLRYDCTGYPEIGSRRELNLCTHLTMIADAFDAMRTLRPYSQKMSQEDVALRMAVDAGTHFDPVLLGKFFRMLDLFPEGSDVVLSTGEEAVVVARPAEDFTRPVVRITRKADGRVGDGRLLDLMRQTGPERVTIVRSAGSETEED